MVVGTREGEVPLLPVELVDRQREAMVVGDLPHGMGGGDHVLPQGGGAILLLGAHGHLHHGVEVHRGREGDLQVTLQAQVDLTLLILSVEVEAGEAVDQGATVQGAGADHAAEDVVQFGGDLFVLLTCDLVRTSHDCSSQYWEEIRGTVTRPVAYFFLLDILQQN